MFADDEDEDEYEDMEDGDEEEVYDDEEDEEEDSEEQEDDEGDAVTPTSDMDIYDSADSIPDLEEVQSSVVNRSDYDQILSDHESNGDEETN